MATKCADRNSTLLLLLRGREAPNSIKSHHRLSKHGKCTPKGSKVDAVLQLEDRFRWAASSFAVVEEGFHETYTWLCLVDKILG